MDYYRFCNYRLINCRSGRGYRGSDCGIGDNSEKIKIIWRKCYVKNVTDLKQELHYLQYELKLRQRVDCSKDDNKKYKELEKNGLPLPEGVYPYRTVDNGESLYQYYTVYIPENFSSEERFEYILLKQFELIKTIKNCVLLFAILTIVSIVIAVIAFLL